MQGRLETYTYKTAAGCEIKADVYTKPTSRSRRPVIITIHGGALMLGSRHPIEHALLDPLISDGFAVVSVDYRLTPETKLPEIVEDVKDAFAWVRREGPELFGADGDRIAVQGISAGGYLSLVAGYSVDPRPAAVVSYSGYSDITADWYAKPDAHYLTHPIISETRARSVVGRGTPTESKPGDGRWDFYLYCRQTGNWPEETVGVDPDVDPDAFTPFCPIRNVTPDYPPTLLYHGDKDTDVPFEQSAQMVRKLEYAGVDVEFMPIYGADHGFGPDFREENQKVFTRTREFLREILG